MSWKKAHRYTSEPLDPRFFFIIENEVVIRKCILIFNQSYEKKKKEQFYFKYLRIIKRSSSSLWIMNPSDLYSEIGPR